MSRVRVRVYMHISYVCLCLSYVCVICVSIQLEPKLHDNDITTVQALEKLGLGLDSGLGFRLGIALAFWVGVRVRVLG